MSQASRRAGVAMALVASSALAEPSAPSAEAERLFEEGKSLWKDPARWAEGCARFAASHRLDPSASTAIKLARCRQREGRPDLAWRTYQEARALNQRTHSGQRQEVLDTLAVREQRALEPTLARLHLEVTPATARASVDDEPLDVGDTALAPGRHRLRIEQAGYVPVELELELAAGSWQRQVVVLVATAMVAPPRVEDATSSSSAPPAGSPPPSSSASSTASGTLASAPRPSAGRGPGAPRAVGLGLGAAGVVTLGVAGYFGLRTLAKLRASSPRCDDAGGCSPTGLSLRHEASRAQTGGLVALGVGAALLGSGIVLVVGPWRGGGATTGLTFGPGAVSWSGAW